MLGFSRDPFDYFGLDFAFGPQSYRVTDSDTAFNLTVDLPGVKESDIQVAIENGTLSVRAQRKGGRSYNFAWSVSDTIDPEGIEAEYEDGVLTLTLPKQEQKKLRKIEVKPKAIAETATA